MAYLRENTLEGGTDTVAVSTANSGGASGDAFTEVSGTELKYSSAQAAVGGMSMRLVDPTGIMYAAWTGLGALTVPVFIRFYTYLSALPPTNRLYAVRVMDDAFESMALMRILSNGIISPADWTNSGVGDATVAIATAQWIRIEMRIVYGTTTGEIAWRLFNTPDSTTPTDSGSVTGVATAAGTGTGLGDVRFGVVTTPTPVAPFTVYYDGLAIDTVDWIGPAAAGPTQAILPDADTTTTGWTTTPLFSKINDSSDATVVTSTLA